MTTTPIEIGTKPTLSPTALSQYMTCGRRGQYYHTKAYQTPTTVGLALGGAWHKGMETYGLSRLTEGDAAMRLMPTQMLIDKLSPIVTGHFDEESEDETFVWGEGESRGEVHEQLYKMLTVWAGDDSYRWMGEGLTITAVESEIVTELGSENHVFRGFLDAVYETPKGVVGVDYKTAGRAWGGAKAAGDPRKGVQAPLYAEAWLRETGQEMDWFTYDVMTYAGKFQRVWVDVKAERRKPFIHRWNQVSQQITMYEKAELDMPTNPDSFLCSEKWCGYFKDVCEMGAALDRKES